MSDTHNIADSLTAMAARQPDQPAVILHRSRKRNLTISYRQLDADSDCLTRGLQQVGIGKGTRTVLMVRPGPDFFSLAFALFKLGAVMVAVDPGIGLKRLGKCLQEAAPEGFVGIPAAHLARSLFRWGTDALTIRVTAGRITWPGSISLAAIRRQGRQSGDWHPPPTRPQDMAAILFTSGSTGPPKGVIYSHGNFIAQIRALQKEYAIRPGEVDLATFPLFALFAPALGMTAVIPEMDFTRPGRVRPEAIIEPINRFGATTMFGSPALLERVGRWAQPRRIKLPSLRRVLSAGAPVSLSTVNRYQQLLSPEAQIFTPYGATEALPVCSIGSQEILSDTGPLAAEGRGICVGRPVSGVEVRIIPITEAPVPAWEETLNLPENTVGEIAVRGPQVTRAYFGLEAETRAAKIRCDDGGWYHRMGDLGYLDEQGRVWFCGRKRHRVVTGTGTLYTIPCEGVFNAHPDVRRSALVGVPAGPATAPVICVEREPAARRRNGKAMIGELLDLGRRYTHTRIITTVLFHPGFPVDIRHNAKIDRERLSQWAARKLR